MEVDDEAVVEDKVAKPALRRKTTVDETKSAKKKEKVPSVVKVINLS